MHISVQGQGKCRTVALWPHLQGNLVPVELAARTAAQLEIKLACCNRQWGNDARRAFHSSQNGPTAT